MICRLLQKCMEESVCCFLKEGVSQYGLHNYLFQSKRNLKNCTYIINKLCRVHVSVGINDKSNGFINFKLV